MKREKPLSLILYIFGPVIRYIVVSELAAAAMSLIWEHFLQEIVFHGADMGYSHTVLTLWSCLRLFLAALAGYLTVRRDAYTEQTAFIRAQKTRRMLFTGDGRSGISEESEQRRLLSLFYAAGDDRIKAQLLCILLPASVLFSVGINVLFSCLMPDSIPAQTVGELPGAAGMLLQALFYCFFMPFVEETVVRGILFPRLQRWYGTGTAILASALFFGLYHGNVSQGIYAFIMGILFAAAYETTGRFTVPFALHGACNLIILFLKWTDAYRAVCSLSWGAAFLGAAVGGFLTIFIIIKKTAG